MLRPSLLQVLLVALMALATVVAADEQPAAEADTLVPRESLQDVLAKINVGSIHDALHALSARFHDGIFPTDISAAEALKEDDETIASVLNVVKRESNATSQIEPILSSVPLPATTATNNETGPSAVDTATTTTSDESTATTTSSSSSSSLTTSSSEDSTATSTEPPTTTATLTTPTSNSGPATSAASTLHTTPSSTSPTPTSTTSTSDHITEGGSSSSITSTYKSTTTMADGTLSTITSTTIVQVQPTDSSATTTSATPGLQTGAAALTTAGRAREVAAMVGGAVMFAMAV